MAGTLKEQLSIVRHNPSEMMRIIMDDLERSLGDTTGEYDVPDPSNPFTYLMEISVLNTAMSQNEQEAILRRQYPSMALTPDELHLHMSDRDYIGRFATPAETTFSVFLSKEELYAKAIYYGEDGARKLVIPRYTAFKIAEHTFTTQYPIELRIMTHGGLQVVYDTTQTSPVKTLNSNQVDWDFLSIKGYQLVHLRVPVQQFAITSIREKLNAIAGFNESFSFTDQFYYARAFTRQSGQDLWKEVKTTHTDQVYDPATVTVAFKLSGNTLNTSIPQIYFTQNQVGDSELRIDIYTTKGPIELDLGAYSAEQFQMQFEEDQLSQTYVSPLTTFSMRQVLCPYQVNGGSNAMSFETLRNQVLNNTLGQGMVPITNAQLSSQLNTRGYQIVTNIDNITNRQFLASRRLPAPQDVNVSGNMNTLMGTVYTKLEELVRSRHVVDNGDRMTVLPSMLYQYRSGVVDPVPDPVLDQLLAMGPDAQARAVNGSRYLYSPLHYVIDVSNDQFDVRPYYLDSPSIGYKEFVSENDTALLEVGIGSYTIDRTLQGWQLTFKLDSGDGFKALEDGNVFVQLGYQPVGENNFASINATFLGIEDGERVYRAEILTSYDLDRDHRLYTTNLTMYDANQHYFSTPLDAAFEISFVVGGTPIPGYRSGELDLLVQDHLLPDKYMVVSRERLNITLGHSLDGLWQRSRTTITSQSYQRYTSDVAYVYEENVYKRDPQTGAIDIEVDDNGDVHYTIEHEKGEIRKDADGNTVMRYQKGDLILDANGEKQLIEPRKLLRDITLFFMDGTYYFVTDSDAVTYRKTMPEAVVGWLENDIDLLRARLLEQSSLYLYPTATLGDTNALVREGQTMVMSIDQHVYVNYYLSDSAYRNQSLREKLKQSTRDIIVEMLARPTVAISDIIARLKINGGNDVISIEVGGLGGDSNYSTVTQTDDAVQFSLRKRLLVLSNQYLAVQDDIDIEFIRHTNGDAGR